ncbi:MAG: hypothetical protein MJ051_01675 [Akkermansia sp.]|nr:hypothetical protein [Akkermansia sp.]
MRARIDINAPQAELNIKAAKRMHLKVVGYDNRIRVLSRRVQARIEIWGCDNTLELEDDCVLPPDSFICIGAPDCPAHHCRIHIGRSSSFDSDFEMRLMENGSEINIGSECMVAAHVRMWCTDTHAILQDGKVVNVGRSITIGDHVWVGLNVYFSKNSGVGNQCIVGWGSLVTRTFTEDNCVIAGNPAAIVKRGVEWQRTRPNSFAHPEEEYPGFRVGGDATYALGRLQLRLRMALYRFKMNLYSNPIKQRKYRLLTEDINARLAHGRGKEQSL